MDESRVRRVFYGSALVGCIALAIALYLAWDEGKWMAWLIGLLAGYSFATSTLLLLSRRHLKEFDALIVREDVEVTHDEIKHSTTYVRTDREGLELYQEWYLFARQSAVPVWGLTVVLGLYFLVWLAQLLFDLVIG